MATRTNDELNNLTLESYFAEAPLTDEQKKQRIDLAEELEVLFLYLFTALSEVPNVREIAEKTYGEIVTKHLGFAEPTAYIVEQAKRTIKEVVRVTLEHEEDISDDGVDSEEDSNYWKSETRALIISANESHKMFEYKSYTDAVKTGMTRKRWKCSFVPRSREDHKIAHGQTVNIFGRFAVGDSTFGYPRDMTYYPSAEQVINCLCTCEYLK